MTAKVKCYKITLPDYLEGYGYILPEDEIPHIINNELDGCEIGDKVLITRVEDMTLEELNELFIDLGYLKPTIMWAVLRKKNTPIEKQNLYRNRTPEFCIRQTDPSD